MFNIRVTRTTRNLEKLIDRIEKLSEETVETGVFIEQGYHPEAELTYVDLANMHEQGADGFFPPRTVRPLVLNSMKEKDFIDKAKSSLSAYIYHGESLEPALDKLGKHTADLGKTFFGVISEPHMPMNELSTTIKKGGLNTPLVEYGYLKDAWAYRTSVSRHIQR